MAMASETRQIWAGAHDLWLEVFLLFNFACLTGDILLAHSENSFRNRAEYIPLWFSGAAALLLLIGLVLRINSQSPGLWSCLSPRKWVLLRKNAQKPDVRSSIPCAALLRWSGLFAPNESSGCVPDQGLGEVDSVDDAGRLCGKFRTKLERPRR